MNSCTKAQWTLWVRSSMFTYALFMSVFYTVTMYALILWITVAKTDISSFRSSTYTLVPEGGARGKEPLQDILSKYQNWDGLGRCGISCLTNKWCFSFFHNSGQRRCILKSRQNVTKRNAIQNNACICTVCNRRWDIFPCFFLKVFNESPLNNVEYFAYVESNR